MKATVLVIDDDETIRHFLPRVLATPAPDPANGDWKAWEELMAIRAPAGADDPGGAGLGVVTADFDIDGDVDL